MGTPGTSTYPTSLDDTQSLFEVNNSAITTLSASITDSTNTISVSSTTSFPNTGSFSIDNEIIYYTGKTSTTFTGCVRGRGGTSASSHSSGTAVESRIIAEHRNILRDSILALQTKVGIGEDSIPDQLNDKEDKEKSINTVTSNYAITDTDDFILANSTSGTITITLPDPSTVQIKPFTIKKISEENNVIINVTGGGNIEGSTELIIVNQFSSFVIISNGSEYYIAAKYGTE